MFFGISMRPIGWVLTLSAVGLALYLPFVAADRLAPMVPSAFQNTMRIGISFLSLPLVLCLLHDKQMLGRESMSVFFYLYKWFYLSVGVAAVVFWGVTSGNFDAGVPVLGAVMTLVGLIVFYVSWRSDKRHEQYAGPGSDHIEAPLDRKTEAILAAAQSRSKQPESEPMVLSGQRSS